jgi:2,3-bisphosphoglycerate-dependent phosphoglycerate mutase
VPDTTTAPVPTIRLENPFAPLTGLCELVLVRHGEQQLSRDTSVDDAVDAPLSELGLRQVEAVGKRLAETEIHAVYSSPLVRAFQTGEAIGSHHGLVPHAVEALREFHPWQQLDAGRSIHDLLSADEVRAIFREHVRTKRFDAFPYSEDRDAFRARINAALGDIIDRHLGERVVVTCHGGVINAFLAAVVGTDQDLPVRVHHTSVSVFRGADTRRSVISVNDFAHVLDLQDSVNPFNL